VGRTPDEVGAMLAALPTALRARAGYGLDTCHLYASGYDLAASRDEVTRVLDAFEAATGDTPSFLHLNDSEGALGSNKDRHARIGRGAIGAEAFGWLLQDPRARGIPCVLETPQAVPEVEETDDAPDAWDVEDLETLRSLAGVRAA
jgi:deoxyribonuclease-4